MNIEGSVILRERGLVTLRERGLVILRERSDRRISPPESPDSCPLYSF